MKEQTFAVILAGGAGTRFWPASRANRPKQLLSLGGDEPLLSGTVRRILPLLDGIERVLVASGRHLAEPTVALLPELPASNLLLEPVPRNTAPCIGWAAARIARTDPDAVVVVMPSDHHVANPERFRRVLAGAIASARSGTITTVGIRPTHPETGYGYIELDSAIQQASELPIVARRFVEKPDRARAEAFVAGGRHLYNAGIFVFRARDMLAAIRQHLPALSAGLDALDAAAHAGEETAALERIYPTLPAVSLDHGVMERLGTFAVVVADVGWSDVGNWHSAWELAAKDEQHNAAPPDAVLIDASGNHVVDLRAPRAGGSQVIALLGVDDLIVVETDDALLIASKSRAQDVKEVVERLKKRGDDQI